MDVGRNASAGEGGIFARVWPSGQILRCPLLQMTPACLWSSWRRRRRRVANEGGAFVLRPHVVN